MKKNLKSKIIIIALIFDLIFSYLYFSATAIILDEAGEAFKSNISNCSYYAIQDYLKDGYDFSQLCKIERDSNGRITLIQTDAFLTNYLVKELALDCYDYMDKVVCGGLYIPSGSLTGLKLLAGYGSKVKVNINSVLSVECKIVRTIESAGINQTRQTLSADILCEITVYAPFYKKYYSESIEVVLLDNLIVGEVPSSYFNATIVASGSVN